MFGCLRRLGCLLVLLVLAGAAYYWWTTHTPAGPAASTAGTWHTVTPADAGAGARAVESLSSTRGKVFANLTPAEAVAYLIQSASKELPESATGVEAMVESDQLHVRAVVPLRDLGAAQALGPMSSMLGARDTVELAGRVDLVRAGLAQMHVTKVRIESFALPQPMIPRLMKTIRRQSPDGLAPDALALPLPPYVGDVRIANGKVTLYKTQ